MIEIKIEEKVSKYEAWLIKDNSYNSTLEGCEYHLGRIKDINLLNKKNEISV